METRGLIQEEGIAGTSQIYASTRLGELSKYPHRVYAQGGVFWLARCVRQPGCGCKILVKMISDLHTPLIVFMTKEQKKRLRKEVKIFLKMYGDLIKRLSKE